jgi:hypothetical protein
MLTALIAAMLAPAAAVALAPTAARLIDNSRLAALPPASDFEEVLLAGLDTDLDNYRADGFTAGQARLWGWPDLWVATILMAWGFWRSLRRGWRSLARRQPPLAWVLSLYGILALAGACFHSGPGGTRTLLALSSLATLLAVFGIADLVRGFMERLVLAPPQERDE